MKTDSCYAETYSELREDVTSNRTLRIIGNRNKLGRYITLAENTATEVNTKIMSAAVRAIVGAAYMDGGTRAAKTVLGQLGFYQAIEDAIKLQESINDTDQHGPITRDTRKRKLSEVERESDPEPDPERIVLE